MELFDLRDDPGETRNLAADRPESATALRQRLRDWRASVNARMPTPNPDFRADAGRPASSPGLPLSADPGDSNGTPLRWRQASLLMWRCVRSLEIELSQVRRFSAS